MEENDKTIIDTITEMIDGVNNKIDSAVIRLASNDLYETRWIPYIKAGSVIKGKPYTEEYLKKLADNYNPNLISASLIVGHSGLDVNPLTIRYRDEIPKFGEIAALKYEGGRIWQKLRNVTGELKEAIENKRYNGFSWEVISKHSDNSVPMPYVGAVAILGVSRPAVAGSYINENDFLSHENDPDIESVIIEFSDNVVENPYLPEDYKKRMIEKFEKEKSVENTQDKTLEVRLADIEKSMQEKDERIKELEAANAEKQAKIELADYENRVAKMEAHIADIKVPAVKTELEKIIRMAAHTGDVVKLGDAEENVAEIIERLSQAITANVKVLPGQINLDEEKESPVVAAANKLVEDKK